MLNNMKNRLLKLIFAGLVCAALSSASYATPWDERYFPNYTLITQDGEEVKFFDDLLKDKVVVLNFIFTSCRDMCPLETARLRMVADLLGDRVGDDVFFYSISIDPETDTPEVLKDYMQKYNIGSGWTFLTGDEDEIKSIRKKLGIYLAETERQNAETGELNHNLSLVIGNQKTGRWMQRSPYENPNVLAAQVGSWLHNWKGAPESAAGIVTDAKFEDAPLIGQVTEGERLFNVRCTACHSIGLGTAADPTDGKVGPDLYFVSKKREAQWLRRWIAEPDVMLEEEDPLAVELFNQYDQVVMPNFRFKRYHIDALVQYMDEESERVRASKLMDM
jgi:protein SCO1/2